MPRSPFENPSFGSPRPASILASIALLAFALGLPSRDPRAHPGSAIALDDVGAIYFTDTGRGVWRLEEGGEPALVSRETPHWFALDRTGAHARSGEKFGRFFQRLTPEGRAPAVLACWEFPVAIAPDGALVYVHTFEPPGRIVRRTPSGEETTLATIAEFPSAEMGQESYVTGLTVAPDGAIFAVQSAAQAERVAIVRVGLDGGVTTVARDFVPASLETESRPAIAPDSLPEGAPVPTLARSYCRGLAVAPDGTIHVAASSCHTLLAIREGEDARVTLRADPPWEPTDVAVRDGNLYVLEYHVVGHDRKYWLPRVRKVDPDGAVRTLVSIPLE